MKKILIINGHPNAGNDHYCDAIAQKYESAALAAGNEVQQINVNELEFELLGSQQEFYSSEVPETIQEVQENVKWAQHLVVIYPLWLGGMPALLKGFFEQVFRPGFAVDSTQPGKTITKLMKGKSARIFVTMGMPGVVYKWFFRAHTLKSLKRNILDFTGFKPVRSTVIGGVYDGNKESLQQSLSEVSKLGQLAQ